VSALVENLLFSTSSCSDGNLLARKRAVSVDYGLLTPFDLPYQPSSGESSSFQTKPVDDAIRLRRSVSNNLFLRDQQVNEVAAIVVDLPPPSSSRRRRRRRAFPFSGEFFSRTTTWCCRFFFFGSKQGWKEGFAGSA